MPRVFRPSADQLRTKFLRSTLCRLGTPNDMAAVSSHLRNYAVAETVGLLGTLDSHPKISAIPIIARTGAQFQQVHGTADNHFAHVAPSSLNLNGKPLHAMFSTQSARDHIERIFGMGVMAPPDWQSLGTYLQVPAVQNRTDVTAESHHSSGGLVAAFESMCQVAANSGRWLGNGKHQHNKTSLADYIEQNFNAVWKPAALAAYAGAQASIAARSSTGTTAAHQVSLLAVQLSTLRTARFDYGEIAQSVLDSTVNEQWNESK
jgi:hypothetical protein